MAKALRLGCGLDAQIAAAGLSEVRALPRWAAPAGQLALTLVPLLALLALPITSCAGAPAPATHRAEAGGATAAPPQPGATGGTVVMHSSEAEPKSAAAAPAAAPPAPPPLVSASPAVAAPAPQAAAASPAGATSGGAAAGAVVAATSTTAVANTAAAGSQPGAAASAPPVAVRPAPAASSLVIPIDGSAAKSNGSLVVVTPADPDPDSTLSLVDAAKAERERKADAPPPRIVINNKNLHSYAKGGQLTVMTPKKGSAAASSGGQAAAGAGSAGAAAGGNGGAAGAGGAAATGSGSVAPLVRDEQYWRGRGLEIRQRWRRAVDRIKTLEGDVNLWRRRFYAEDDPYVRDGQIKPAWDRSIEDLREDRETAASARKELSDFMEEGRQAGALPGWLREGTELEPKDDEQPAASGVQSTATPLYKDHG